MANIVLPYSEIEFWIGSMLSLLFTFQNREIILPGPVLARGGFVVWVEHPVSILTVRWYRDPLSASTSSYLQITSNAPRDGKQSRDLYTGSDPSTQHLYFFTRYKANVYRRRQNVLPSSQSKTNLNLFITAALWGPVSRPVSSLPLSAEDS
jgi:hypothetical protein